MTPTLEQMVFGAQRRAGAARRDLNGADLAWAARAVVREQDPMYFWVRGVELARLRQGMGMEASPRLP